MNGWHVISLAWCILIWVDMVHINEQILFIINYASITRVLLIQSRSPMKVAKIAAMNITFFSNSIQIKEKIKRKSEITWIEWFYSENLNNIYNTNKVGFSFKMNHFICFRFLCDKIICIHFISIPSNFHSPHMEGLGNYISNFLFSLNLLKAFSLHVRLLYELIRFFFRIYKL